MISSLSPELFACLFNLGSVFSLFSFSDYWYLLTILAISKDVLLLTSPQVNKNFSLSRKSVLKQHFRLEARNVVINLKTQKSVNFIWIIAVYFYIHRTKRYPSSLRRYSVNKSFDSVKYLFVYQQIVKWIIDRVIEFFS